MCVSYVAGKRDERFQEPGKEGLTRCVQKAGINQVWAWLEDIPSLRLRRVSSSARTEGFTLEVGQQQRAEGKGEAAWDCVCVAPPKSAHPRQVRMYAMLILQAALMGNDVPESIVMFFVGEPFMCRNKCPRRLII